MKTLDSELQDFYERLLNISIGTNLLFEKSNSFSLLKYNPSYISRDTYGDYIRIPSDHIIRFDFDKEFEIHMPSSSHDSVSFPIKGQLQNLPKIISDKNEITLKLQEITRPLYFHQNIKPFLESNQTELKIPKWKRFRLFNMNKAWIWFNEETIDIERGDFVYVGGKKEVYLLGFARDEFNYIAPYMQGTYFTSTKPMLWFSNNFLGEWSKTDMEKPRWREKGDVISSQYRVDEAPGFNGKPFIFSAIGRKQDCKNHMFTGQPDIITGDINEAISHFRDTDFSEFEDIVIKYAERIRESTPNAQPNTTNGKYFY